VTCDFSKPTCQVSPAKDQNLTSELLNQIEELKQHWELYVIYDFDINDDHYKFTHFKLPIKKSPEPLGENDFLFSNQEFINSINKDLSFIMKAKPSNLVIGSEMNLLFAQMKNSLVQKLEIKSFWQFVKKTKKTLNVQNISTSLFFEQMRGMNFWNTLDQKELESLDFLTFNSAPLSSEWAEYSSFFPQFYLNIQSANDIVARYYSELEPFRVLNKKIVLSEFSYPWEKNDPFRMRDFLKTSNFTSYFSYIPFILDSAPKAASYDIKTKYLTIETIENLSNQL
jgi:hypothetical protein